MLGDKIREARKVKSLTLTSLAEQIGVTPGHISQIERNTLEPSLSVLRRLSEVLEVPVPVLFSAGPTNGVVVIRKDKRMKVKPGGANIEYEILSPLSRKSAKELSLNVLQFKLSPKGFGSEEITFHDSDMCIYVLEGSLECSVNGIIHEIKDGESIYIPENTGYMLYNPEDAFAKGIIVITPTLF